MLNEGGERGRGGAGVEREKSIGGAGVERDKNERREERE
jgi:hypothetical protein